jgi:TPP-dependent pyruvate/acetoin dehydrogenase alpha subunit
MVLNNDDLLRLYRRLVLARAFEEKILELQLKVKLQETVHSGLGMEAVGIGALAVLKEDDFVVTTHRGYANKIGKGICIKKFLADLYGKKDGYCKGRDSHHLTVKEINIIGKWGLIGAQFPLAVGLGIAAQFNGKKQVCLAFFGDGSSNRGTFHESLNLSALWKLPIIWACENNQYSFTTPISSHTAAKSIASYAETYLIAGETVDGNDVMAVYMAVQKAVERARRAEGPSIVEFLTYRIRSHFEGSEEVRSQSEIEAWKERDPVITFEKALLGKGILLNEDIRRIRKEIAGEIEGAVKFAEEAAEPGPESVLEDLYA